MFLAPTVVLFYDLICYLAVEAVPDSSQSKDIWVTVSETLVKPGSILRVLKVSSWYVILSLVITEERYLVCDLATLFERCNGSLKILMVEGTAWVQDRV